MIRKIFRMLNRSAMEIPVTSQPVSFPPHPIPEGMLRHSFASPSRREGHQAFGTHMVHRETFFANPVASSSAPFPQELNPWSPRKKSRFTHPQWKRMRDKLKINIRDISLDRQPKILTSPLEETLQRIVGQTNDDCRFQISILTNSYTSHVCLLEDKSSRQRYVLVHNFTRKLFIGSKKWRCLIQWMILFLRHSCSRFVGSDCFCPWKLNSDS